MFTEKVIVATKSKFSGLLQRGTVPHPFASGNVEGRDARPVQRDHRPPALQDLRLRRLLHHLGRQPQPGFIQRSISKSNFSFMETVVPTLFRKAPLNYGTSKAGSKSTISSFFNSNLLGALGAANTPNTKQPVFTHA